MGEGLKDRSAQSKQDKEVETGATESVGASSAVASSCESSAEIDYIFGQVDTKTPKIDWRTACGNLASAIPCVAREMGLLLKDSPVLGEDQVLRVWQVNKGYSLELCELPGNEQVAISGVPGSRKAVSITFLLGHKKNLLPLGMRQRL
ncbi:unnamed protein product [Amoebophrya sp. A25]|nr:unnamed protein product [Amoebophrya sp. A25]|eukprot:GSA25T00005414001.1